LPGHGQQFRRAGVTTDEYVERKQQDGAEAVEWIARQP
jgi:predicted acyl esterase